MPDSLHKTLRSVTGVGQIPHVLQDKVILSKEIPHKKTVLQHLKGTAVHLKSLSLNPRLLLRPSKDRRPEQYHEFLVKDGSGKS